MLELVIDLEPLNHKMFLVELYIVDASQQLVIVCAVFHLDKPTQFFNGNEQVKTW